MRIFYFWVVLSVGMTVIKSFQKAESHEHDLGVIIFGEFMQYI